MKYYKNTDNQVYAYNADGSQDEFILPNLVAISEEEAVLLTSPTVDEICNQNESIRNSLITEANEKITILQDIIELDMQESNEEEQLKQWKKYRVQLNRIDIKQAEKIQWPEKP